EALHEAVLLRLARRDVVPFDAVVLGPLEHGISGELGSVVGDDHLWLAALGHDPIERADNPRTRERGIDLGGKPLAGELILDVEHPEASARLQHVRHEVEHPNLVWPLRLAQWRPRADRALATTPPANRKPFLGIQPVDLLQFHAPSLAFAHPPQPPVAEPAPFGRQRPQQFAIRRVVLALLAVTRGRPVDLEQPRGASLRQSVTLNNVVNCRMTRPRRQKFFPTRSLSAALSSICSANSFFSRRFSSSRARSLRASDTSRPPNFAFHLSKVVPLTPCRRHSSSALAPASCSFKIPMLCSSVK